jgi:ABC-type phosphate transport system auxiliary subunit
LAALEPKVVEKNDLSKECDDLSQQNSDIQEALTTLRKQRKRQQQSKKEVENAQRDLELEKGSLTSQLAEEKRTVEKCQADLCRYRIKIQEVPPFIYSTAAC